MLPVFPPRMPQFHGLFAIVVVFGGKAAFHLIELRSIIAAKEDNFPFLLNPESLMIRAMPTIHFVSDVVINGARIIIEPENVGIVFEKRELVRKKRREAGIHGVFKLAALYKIGSIVEGTVEFAVFIAAAYPTRMILVQVAHQYFGYLFGLNAVGLQVGNKLQFAIFGKAKPGVEQDNIAACNHTKGLHLYHYTATRPAMQGVFGFIKRNKHFIGGYGKSAFAEGDDFHKNGGCVKIGVSVVENIRMRK